MGCIVSSVACCFCSSAASLCCSCLPSCKSSTSSRLVYAIILILSTLLCAFAMIPGLKSTLAKIPALCTPFKAGFVNTGVKSGLDCELITGYGAVYRICFGTTMFFLLFCLVMIRVHSSKDPRSKIQNGFWFFKFLIWFSLIVASFFIPVEGFTTAWMIIGMIGGALFVLIQLILLIDFAHSWNAKWLELYEENDNKWYACAIVGATLVFYSLSLTGVVCLYLYYANAAECVLGKAFVSLNLIFCVLVSVLSMLPVIRKRLSQSGLLQSSLITLYVIYLTWSALTNVDNPTCNPIISYSPVGNSTTPTESVAVTFDWHVFVGLLTLILSVLYSAIRSSSSTAIGKLTIDGTEDTTLADKSSGHRQEGQVGQTVWDDEEEGVAYDYSMYHFMLLLATLYVMVTLTNWYSPHGDLKTLTTNPSSVWVRIVTSWVCLLLYVWTLVAPLIFPDREF